MDSWDGIPKSCVKSVAQNIATTISRLEWSLALYLKNIFSNGLIESICVFRFLGAPVAVWANSGNVQKPLGSIILTNIQ
tara:strand:- start:8 stop:244 length:237 start_codon:yes stop_codon:yes gene_type:complete